MQNIKHMQSSKPEYPQHHTHWRVENTGWSCQISWFQDGLRFPTEIEATNYGTKLKEVSDREFDRNFDPEFDDPKFRTLFRVVKVENILTDNSRTTIETWTAL